MDRARLVRRPLHHPSTARTSSKQSPKTATDSKPSRRTREASSSSFWCALTPMHSWRIVSAESWVLRQEGRTGWGGASDHKRQWQVDASDAAPEGCHDKAAPQATRLLWSPEQHAEQAGDLLGGLLLDHADLQRGVPAPGLQSAGSSRTPPTHTSHPSSPHTTPLFKPLPLPRPPRWPVRRRAPAPACGASGGTSRRPPGPACRHPPATAAGAPAGRGR